ncbi:TetR/AcrR family transcriptional regulator [Demequina sp. NBRC 110055]|uniref:TetR/AcrR family transcriptional regulator n=1 Tax=Demequina sp. NBRC 110055 TaxID=1570344 RepID=UPI000A050518|nr:TetR/AcrR family transcriptional regulator [Demequina sp. NBRC 110055]
MPRPATNKRERLTAAAILMARESGLESATIAAIAGAADVPAGSVYYYFKTKDDVAAAVAEGIATLLADARESLDAPDDRAALTGFLRSYLEDAAGTVAYGTLLSTAATVGGADAHRETLGWLTSRFAGLGFTDGAARARALHLLAGVEGGGALAHALGDAEPLEREVAHLERWVANAGG